MPSGGTNSKGGAAAGKTDIFQDVLQAGMPTDPDALAQEHKNLALVDGWTSDDAIKYYTYYNKHSQDKVFHVEDANRKIWKQQPLTPSEVAKLKKLDAGVKTLPTHTGTVHRYMGFHDPKTMTAFVSGLKVGSTASTQGFMSTSQKESVSKGFANMKYFNGASGVMMKIHAKGQNGHSLTGKSAVSAEAEVLFRHGSKFKVVKSEAWKGQDTRIKHFVELSEI